MNFEKLDRARIAAALVAAILTGGAALYGVYQKSREATAASYETLAPEINDLKGDVEQLRQENHKLREALTRTTGVKVPASDPEATARARASDPATAEGRPAPRRPRRAETARAAGTTADAGAVATAPPAAPPPPGTPPAESPPEPPAGADDPIEGIKKRVPIDFDKAVQVWKDVQSIRKNLPQRP
jgi:TolA-binding protein